MKKKKVISVYRHYIDLNRGTPLRVGSLVFQAINSGEFEYHTASQDDRLHYSKNHLKLVGSNLSDVLSVHRYIREHAIDIIVLHTLASAYFLPLLKLLHPTKKFVLEMHGFMEEESLLYGDISLFKYYRNKGLYACLYWLFHAVSTCSDTATAVLRKYNKNVCTIFGGVDLQKFNVDIKPSHSFKESPKEIIIGYAGNARKWQGVDLLIEAFIELNKKDPDFKLVLLLSEKLELPESSHITVLDPVPHEEVGAICASFDVLVIPRPKNKVNDVSFPSKLMEYLAMGKPVVGSRTSDMYKIIAHKEDGLLYEPGSKKDLIECLELLKNKIIRENIGQAAAKKVKSKYTWEHQGALFVSLLKNVSM